jgi:hypothetical protein
VDPPANPRAELSSISTALDDLAQRVSGIAERSKGTDLDWLTTSLYEAERRLNEVGVRLGVAMERLRRQA